MNKAQPIQAPHVMPRRLELHTRIRLAWKAYREQTL
jgi:hypothetical protein